MMRCALFPSCFQALLSQSFLRFALWIGRFYPLFVWKDRGSTLNGGFLHRGTEGSDNHRLRFFLGPGISQTLITAWLAWVWGGIEGAGHECRRGEGFGGVIVLSLMSRLLGAKACPVFANEKVSSRRIPILFLMVRA